MVTIIYIKPEYTNLWRKEVREAANFFKHADRDPDGFIEFNETINEYDITFILANIRALGKNLSPIQGAFWGWFTLNHPNLILAEVPELYPDPDTAKLIIQWLAEAPREASRHFLLAIIFKATNKDAECLKQFKLLYEQYKLPT